jgi:uncharacterized protein with HEPN domain
MQPETRKYLYDVFKACEAILQFVKDKSFEDYDADLMLCSAVERQFMIVGEAVNNALRLDEELEERIEDARDIISLRNVIAHGYAIVENKTVWGIVQADLPKLYEQVKVLLALE